MSTQPERRSGWVGTAEPPPDVNLTEEFDTFVEGADESAVSTSETTESSDAGDSSGITKESAAASRPRHRAADLLAPEAVGARRPAQEGWRGALNRVGFKLKPGPVELSARQDKAAICLNLSRCVTITVANPDGGAGKALEASEPVLTPSGYRPIGSLQVGDLVVGTDGLSYDVRGVYPQGKRDLYRVTLTDGTVITADGEHLWEVETDRDRVGERGACTFAECARPVMAEGLCSAHYGQASRGKALGSIRVGNYTRVERTASGARLMTTEQLLQAGLWTDRPGRGRRHKFFIRVCSPIKLNPGSTPLDPYLLGLLLGDGSLGDTTPAFTTADPELVAAVEATLPPGAMVRHKAGYDYRLVRTHSSGINPVTAVLRELDLMGKTSEHKFIPDLYKVGDLDTRTAVLQGLLDTDGCAEKGVAASFTTVSRRLADDVKHVAESLGCVVIRRSPRVTTYWHGGEVRHGQLAHTVSIKPPSGLELFRLERKATKMRAGQRAPYRAIASIEPAGRGEAVCIAVASPDHMFLTRNCVPTHNTPLSAVLAGAFGLERGGGVVAWDNNELRGALGLRTASGGHSTTVRDLLDVGTAADTGHRGDVDRFLRHQQAGHYKVLASADGGDQPLVSGEEFFRVHNLLERYFDVIVIDTGNNEGAENWRSAIEVTDQLVVPVKWKATSCTIAVQMLEALEKRGLDRLVSGAVIVAMNGPGDASSKHRQRYLEYFQERARAVIEVPTDAHIHHDGVIEHDALDPRTARVANTLAARVAEGLAEAQELGSNKKGRE